MPLLNEWIDEKLANIANKLPSQVHENPDSFMCGHTMGYKQCLLDLERFMEELKEVVPAEIFQSHWEIF